MKSKVASIIFIVIFIGTLITLGYAAPPTTIDDFKLLNQAKEYLPENIVVVGGTAYIYVEYMDFQRFYRGLTLLKPFKIDKIVIDLYSHGGAVFDAMAIGAIITEQIRDGRVVEVNARGLVASAGLIILVSGSNGYRYIDRDSMVMFHELSVFDYLSFKSVSDKEEEARVLRLIQDKINSYITTRSKISSKDLSDKIKKKECWLSAQETIQLGFADAFIK